MRKLVLLLTVLSFMSCQLRGNSVPTLAYRLDSKSEDSTTLLNHQKWHSLLQKHVSNSGKVDYVGFKKDNAALKSYLDILASNPPSKRWSRNAVLAYWINAYNAFTLKLIIDNYPVESIKDIKKPWDREFIDIGGRIYSLGDIEHKILRKMNEPRIHFAINCASYSCPNLWNEAYIEGKLEQQLKRAATAFINDESKNTISKDHVEISKIFDWFSADFKKQGSLIDFINIYSKVKINTNAKIRFRDYNWRLNN